MSKISGFSLVETVISVAIMGMVIITVLGVFVSGNNAIKKGRSIVIATNIAEKKISEVRNLLAKNPKYGVDITEAMFKESISAVSTIDNKPIKIWNGDEVTQTALSMNPTSVTIEGTEEIARTGEYEFEIKIIDYIDSTLTDLPDLKKISVKITWTDPPSTEIKSMEINTLIAKE